MISSYTLLNDLRAHYLVWDKSWRGQPVLMLHGLASNARIWELVAPHLLTRGYFPIALDQRGHGLTDKPDGDYGFDVFTRDLATFIDVCNIERPILIGHSWGAMVVLDYASRIKVGPRAPRGIILVDGGLTQLDDVPGATWESTRDRLTPPKLAGMPLADFMTRIQNGAAGWVPSDEAINIILGNFQIRADETIAPNLSFENHMKIVRAMWDFKTYDRFAALLCPALSISARPLNPTGPSAEFLSLKERGAARIQSVQPKARIEWMDDTIHDIPLHKPEALAKLIAEFASTL